MIELIGPGGTFRDVRYGDEAAVLEILSDWQYGGKSVRAVDAANMTHKWVHDMTVQPGDHPATSDSTYREALIAFMPTGEPLALCVYVVRGGNDPKNWPLAVTALYTEVFAVAPAYRDQGRMDALLNTLIRSAFEDTGADVLIHDLVDTPQMRSHQTDRSYQQAEERDTAKGRRIRVAFTRADHQTRMAANPAEARMRHEFSSLSDSSDPAAASPAR